MHTDAKERVLVVVTDGVTAGTVDRLIAAYVECELVVVAPLLLGRLDYWAGDDRQGRREAAKRLASWVGALGQRGAEVNGHVGFDDPLQVIEDELAALPGGHVVIAGSTSSCRHWQARDLARRAQNRFGVAVADLTPARRPDEQFASAA